jgi:hypothetical protein
MKRSSERTHCFSGSKCSYTLCDEHRVLRAICRPNVTDYDIPDSEAHDSRIAELRGASGARPNVKFGGM